MRKLYLVLFLLVSVAVSAQQPQQQTQSKAYLEAKRKEIQDAIKETERELDEIKKNKNATLSQLRTLQYKLAQRQNLINNINQEIDNIDNNIASSSKEIVTLKQKLEMEKMRYSQSLRYAYSTRSSYDMLAFVFSSADFNDAVRRMKYLKKFRDFRQQQVEEIKNTQNQIEHKIGDLNKQKAEKDNMLVMQQNQTKALSADVQETSNVVQSLKGKEKELMREIEKNRQVAARINKAINAIIEREMAAAAKRAEDEARKRNGGKVDNGHTGVKPGNDANVSAPTGSGRRQKGSGTSGDESPLMMTPSDVTLANNFEGNRGKLYWPVTQGTISEHFGRHPHPLEPTVMVDQAGISIRTTPNATVYSVFEGTVVSRFSTGGSDLIIIVQHGNYFTVYNGLASSNVTAGQHVGTKQALGTVAENDEGVPTINFQIWKATGSKGAREKLNPELWIGRAR